MAAGEDRAGAGPPSGKSRAAAAQAQASQAAAAASQAASRAALGEFTKSLVQTIDRSSYYEPGHPAHYVLSDELYAGLGTLLADQAQIGYVLRRGAEPEVLVDGLPMGRVMLKEIFPAGVYDMFVPRFIAYFDRFDLVALSFRKDLSREEFAAFVGIISRPVLKREEAVDLPATLIEAKILHISALCTQDLDLADEDLPWQVRISLGRLRRDLRSVPFFSKSSAEELKKIKLEIFRDIVRPLAQADQLKMLVLYGPRVEKDVANVEGLQDLRIAETMIRVLAHNRLCQLTDALLDDLDAGGTTAKKGMVAEMTSALIQCQRRLLSEDIDGAEATLRQLYEHDVVELEELPGELQEWVLAEGLRDQLEGGTLPDLPSESARDVRVLGKLAHLTLLEEKFEHTVAIIEFMRQLALPEREFAEEAAFALVGVAHADDLAEIVDKMENGTRREADGMVRLLKLLGLRGAIAIGEGIVRSGANARFGNAYHLLDEMPVESAGVVADLLRRPDLQAPVLRVLLALVSRHPTDAGALAALAHVPNGHPLVRLAALSAAATHPTVEVVEAFRRALEDGDPEVALLAMATLAERPDDAALARVHAIKILGAATPTSQADHLAAAVKVLAQSRSTAAERAAALGALQRFIDQESRGGFLGLGKAPHPAALEAAEAALDALGGGGSDGGEKRSGWRDLFRK
ncbi:MAG: hypothetical protein EXR72_10805 [Myxococcales bacterium]|nr:hypothetical protein [Myxococcales bacterium]